MRKLVFKNQKGIALVTALILTLAIMAMATGVLYFINYSITLSSAGKRYATAAAASDGGVDLAKDAIYQIMYGNSPPTGFAAACLINAVTVENAPCSVTVTLPGTMSASYNVTVTVTRLYTDSLAGGRIEFARSAGGAPSAAVYYRITTLVASTSDNTTAENAVLYRFTG